MQEQVLRESAEVRLTEEEANLFVALHAEHDQKDGATTLHDLAETLRMPLSEARLLLAEVRTRIAISKPVAETVAVPAVKRRRPRRWVRAALFCAFTAMTIAVSYQIGFDSSYRHHPFRSYDESRGPVFAEAKAFDPTTQLPEYMGVQVGTSAVVSQHADHISPDSILIDKDKESADMSKAVLEGLERVISDSNQEATNIRVAIGPWNRDWTQFPVHLGPEVGEKLLTPEGAEAIRRKIENSIKAHWDAIRAAPRR